MQPPAANRQRIHRVLSEHAVKLAVQNRWDEAVTVNRKILELFPDDVEALNRLGRALTELGKYSEALEAYQRALELDPNNTIARKNRDRLMLLREREEEAAPAERVSPELFVAEPGKTGSAQLINLGPQETLAKLAAGDQVELRVHGNRLEVYSTRGEYIGQVEPKVGLRLASLIRGGNQYVAAVQSLSDGNVRVIIREVFQHPSQAGRVSFPTREPEAVRPYTREDLVRVDQEEEEEEFLFEEEEELHEEAPGIAGIVEEPEILEEEGLPIEEAAEADLDEEPDRDIG